MTRRRTSVIGPGRAGAFAQASPAASSLVQPDAQTVWRWSLAAARELSLELESPSSSEAERLAAAQGHWDVAHGRASGQRNNGRSEIKRVWDPKKGSWFWRKAFVDRIDQRFMVNEIHVLTHIATTDLDRNLGLRTHVAWGRFVNGDSDSVSSTITHVESLDAGPNLRNWRAWAPCIDCKGFALPVFIQAHFIAAMTRKLLLALEAFTASGAVHNDVWDENLCWELPKAASVKQQVWSAKIDLQRLEVRLIDFETSFIPGRQRLDHPHENPWVSPFVKACRQLAMEPVADGAGTTPKHPQDKQAILAAIDWGADLWSLGHLLYEWIEDATLFMDRWLNAVRETFGDDSPVCAHAYRVAGEQADALQPLQAFAHRLKAQDRPLSEVGQTYLHERTPTHAALRIQLEGDFRLLTSGRNSDVVMHWIDPHTPLHAPPVGRLVVAWARGASSLRSRLRTHKRAIATVAAVAAVSGALLSPSVHQVAADAAGTQVNLVSNQSLRAWLVDGNEMALRLAQVLGINTTTLGNNAWADPQPSTAKAQAQRSLRRLVAWSLAEPALLDGPHREQVLTDLAQFRDHYEQAKIEGQWQQFLPGQPGKPANGLDVPPLLAGQALMSLSAILNEPLPRAYAIELIACWGSSDQHTHLPEWLANLHQRGGGPSRAADYYLSLSEQFQQRLQAGKNPCLLDLP